MYNSRNVSSSISVVRVISMLLVVVYHCMLYYTDVWSLWGGVICRYSGVCNIINYIDIPAFVIISGYLYESGIRSGKYKKCGEFIKNKFCRLILPYLFWGCVMLIIQPDLYNPSLFLEGFHHLWFLLMLFWIFIFIHLTHQWWQKFPQIVDIVVFPSMLIFSICIFRTKVVPGYFAMPSTVRFLPIFYYGILIAKYNLLDRSLLNLLKIGVKMLAVFGAGVIIVISAFCLGYAMTAIYQLIGCLMSFGLLYFFCNIEVPKRFNETVLKPFSQNSMGIYIIHHIVLFFILSFDNVRDFMNIHYMISPLLLLIVLLPFSFLASSLIRKSWLKWTC